MPPSSTLITPITTPAGQPHHASVTVMSANLLNPFFRPGRLDWAAIRGRLERFATLVECERADIVLCQEVGRSHEFRVDEWLASRLGMGAVYELANGPIGELGWEEGLAILSRHPLSAPVTCLLGGGLWRRPALGAVVASPLGELAVYTAHLSLRPWRNRRQPAALRGWVAATSGGRPAIVGGDFNAHETEPHMRRLRREWVDCHRVLHPEGAAVTHEMGLLGFRLRRRLDYLFLQPGNPGFRVVFSAIQQTAEPFSDHHAVLARFEHHGR